MTIHVPLPGSRRPDFREEQLLGRVPPDAAVEFTVVLRRRAALPAELIHGPRSITRDELAARYGADPADVALVYSVFAAAGARVAEVHEGSRRISAAATASVASELFGIELHLVHGVHPGSGRSVRHRAHRGDMQVPAALNGIVLAVLGLDDRPQARRYLHRPGCSDVPDPVEIVFGPPGVQLHRISYTPPQLAAIYDFPAADGTGQTAAILEFGGGFDPDAMRPPIFAGWAWHRQKSPRSASMARPTRWSPTRTGTTAKSPSTSRFSERSRRTRPSSTSRNSPTRGGWTR